MKLETYLQAIKDCSDEEVEDVVSGRKCRYSKLYQELGITDNFPILLGASLDELVKSLKQIPNFKFRKKYESITSTTYAYFDYNPRTVVLQLIDDASINYFSKDFPEKEEIIKKYKTAITLHDYLDNKIQGISGDRAIALVVNEIAGFAIKEGISLCFPSSRGYPRKDFSQTVFYEHQGESK